MGVDERPLYQYQADLDPPCTLRAGWVQITGGVGPGSCTFYWQGGLSGDHLSFSEGFPHAFDLSVCLTANTQGACCVDNSEKPPGCSLTDSGNCSGMYLGDGTACGSDCNANSASDACEIAVGFSPDCNLNGVPDDCDLAAGTSQDCNGTTVPDECELVGQDCNANGIPDGCEVPPIGPSSNDCNANGVPDSCDVLSLDCNNNGVPDDCEPDCNGNGVPNDCEIASMSSLDCNGNGIPDDCEFNADLFGAFYRCAAGPEAPYPSLPSCGLFDFNRDSHVDLVDFAVFQVSDWDPASGMEPPTMSAPMTAPEVEVNETVQADVERSNSSSVYLFSGEFYFEQEDLRIPGRGFDFVWKRKYRSREGLTTPMGVNWDHSYNIFLEPLGSRRLILHDGNGRSDVYLRASDDCNRWIPPPGVFRELTRDPATGEFTLTFVHRTKWIFHPLDGQPQQGRIKAIDDRHDALNRMTFAYDAAGRLTAVTDCLGRVVHVEYNPASFISRVIDFAAEYADPNLSPPDPRGRVVQYGYDAEGNLTSATLPADIAPGHPELVRFPGGITWTYTYSAGFSDERLNHNLLTITDGRGNDPNDPIDEPYLDNTYGSTLGPFVDNVDRVIRQQLGNAKGSVGGTYAYSYIFEGFEPGVRIQTRITDRAGNIEDLFYDAGNRLIKRIEHTNRDIRPGEGDYTTLYEYNDDSLLTRMVYPNGNELRQTFDSGNVNPRARGNRLSKLRDPGPLGADPFQPELCERWGYGRYYNFITHYLDSRGESTFWNYDGETTGFAPSNCNGAIPPTRGGGGPGGGSGDGVSRGCAARYVLLDDSRSSSDSGECTGCRSSTQYDSYGRLLDEVNEEGRQDAYMYVGDSPYMSDVIVDSDGFALLTSYARDSVGNVLATTDPNGHVTTHVVNASGQVMRTTRPLGYTTDYVYDANGNLAQVEVQNIDETGAVQPNAYFTTSYEYDLLDNMVQMAREIDDAHFAATQYGYDANENLTLMLYPEAVAERQPHNAVAMQYDERDRVYTRTRGWNSQGSAPAGASTMQYDYDGNGNLTRRIEGIEDGTSRTYTFSYDGYNRQWAPFSADAAIDPMGNGMRYEYDHNGNRTRTSSYGQTPDVAGAAGNALMAQVLEFHDSWNFNNQVLRYFYPTGQHDATQTYGINNLGQFFGVRDDNGHTTWFDYDTANRLVKATDPKGNTRTITAYDANSNPLTIEERDYDDAHPPHDCCETDHGAGCSDGPISDCVCDAQGHPECCDINGDWTSECAMLVQSGVCGSCPEYEALTTMYEYDPLNRLTQTTDNAGTRRQFKYDSRNNRVLETLLDGQGQPAQQTRYVYDGLSRRVQTIMDLDGDGAIVGDASDIIVGQDWDDDSRLTAQIDDNGNATRYEYDALNRRTAIAYADGTRETMTYDVHDNVVERTDANGSVVTNTYDLLNRLTHRAIAPGSGVSNDTTAEDYQYDGLSRIVYAADNDSVVTREYNTLGNIITETLSIDGSPARTVATEYDGVGNILRLIYPGGRNVQYQYDGLDRIAAVSDDGFMTSIATYEYIGPDRVKQRDYKNNTRMTYSYDVTQYVRQVAGTTHQFDPDGTPAILDQRTYTWSDACAACSSGGSRNKTSRSNLLTGATHNYYYDRANRMTRTIVGSGVIPAPPAYDPANPNGYLRDTVYSLDGVHNRYGNPAGDDVLETGTLPSVPGPYVGNYEMVGPDFEMNQYTATPMDRRGYDANGNLVERRAPGGGALLATITYDYRNQMVRYSDALTGQNHVYRYDCFRRRIAKVVDADGAAGGPTETRFFHGGRTQWQVLEERDAMGATLGTYVYGNYIDELLGLRRGGSNYFYHADDLFNIMGISDSLGSVVERYEYGDFGKPDLFDGTGNAIPATQIGNRYLFTGREYDTETRLYHYRTRYLEPIAGRFTARDTIGAWSDSPNMGNGSAYVGNRPMVMTDPSGGCMQPRPPSEPPSEPPGVKYDPTKVTVTKKCGTKKKIGGKITGGVPGVGAEVGGDYEWVEETTVTVESDVVGGSPVPAEGIQEIIDQNMGPPPPSGNDNKNLLDTYYGPVPIDPATGRPAGGWAAATHPGAG